MVSGPARSGNHLLISMLDNHPQIASEIGEDDFLRTIFSYANVNEKKLIKDLKNFKSEILLNSSGQPKLGKGKGKNKWKALYEIYKNCIKSNVWSGNQPEGSPHITDFQEIVPKINYESFITK